MMAPDGPPPRALPNRHGFPLSVAVTRPISRAMGADGWKARVRGAGIGSGLVLALALLLGSCDGPSTYQDLSGERIYHRLCTQCHGEQGRALHGRGGTYLGKRKYWTQETLLEYLEDPQAYKRKAPHLSASRYMPPLNPHVPAEARVRLVDHVLGLMDALEAGRR